MTRQIDDNDIVSSDSTAADSRCELPEPVCILTEDLHLLLWPIPTMQRFCVVPKENIHFPTDVEAYSKSYDEVRCVLMQGGQGEVKHWAFNDPPKREGSCQDQPPATDEYRKLGTRITELHPMTVIQNARTSGGGYVPQVPIHAATVGPVETWKSGCVSIWHPGIRDNPFGMRLTALMISKRTPDTAVPMSLLADHPNVRFSFYRGGIGVVEAEMH